MEFFNFGLSGIFAYPPTEDQLRIMDPYYWLADGNVLIWVLRLFSLLLMATSLWLWFLMLRKLVDRTFAFLSVLIISISPTFLVLWLLHPLDCLKICFVSIIVYFFSNKFSRNGAITATLLVILYLLLFSLLATKERASFFHKLGFADSQTETMDRFGGEDSLTDPLKIPLQLRRMVYNKYYLSYKQIINEAIPFFDLETVFFQEVHPMEQKSVVIFYWPEVFLFLTGLYFLTKIKNKGLVNFVFVFFLIAFANFIFSPNQIYRKFELILLPMSVLLALPVYQILFRKSFVLNKILCGIAVFVSIYGFFANMVDINRRPDYWLDNRPMYFDFVYKTLKANNALNYENVRVSSLVGNAEKYCRYYFKRCSKTKFSFTSFDLSKEDISRNTIYAGFVGEFIGSDFKNNINKDWKGMVAGKGINILETKNLRDTIAYKYGNDIVIGEIK